MAYSLTDEVNELQEYKEADNACHQQNNEETVLKHFVSNQNGDQDISSQYPDNLGNGTDQIQQKCDRQCEKVHLRLQ